jgi:hypothetical protein
VLFLQIMSMNTKERRLILGVVDLLPVICWAGRHIVSKIPASRLYIPFKTVYCYLVVLVSASMYSVVRESVMEISHTQTA